MGHQQLPAHGSSFWGPEAQPAHLEMGAISAAVQPQAGLAAPLLQQGLTMRGILPNYPLAPHSSSTSSAGTLAPPHHFGGFGLDQELPPPAGLPPPGPGAPPHLPMPMGADAMHLEQLMMQAAATQPAGQRPPRPQSSGSTVFWAGVTPIVTSETLLTLFSQFGRVMDLNVFRPYRGCRTTKGCGLVVFSTPEEAAAAMDALHGKFVWPGARSAMVIEWMDPHKQHKKRRAQPLTHTLLQQLVTLQQAQASQLLPGLMGPGPLAFNGHLNGQPQPSPFGMMGH